MTYPEFWVLERAIEGGVSLDMIVASPRVLEEQWNRPFHGLDVAEMTSLLLRLLEEGDIQLRESGQANIPVPNEEQLRDWMGLGAPQPPAYWLTSQGGARWERFASADWERFYSEEYDREVANVVEVLAATSENAERAFQLCCRQNHWWVDRAMIERRAHRPWYPVYWKSLPVGYGVKFSWQELSPSECDSYYGDGLTSDEIRLRDDYVHRDWQYFQSWHRPHPETPAFQSINMRR